MIPDSEMTTAVVLPTVIPCVYACDSDPAVKAPDFQAVLSGLLEDLHFCYCFLGYPCDFSRTLTSLEMTVHSDDRARVPLLFERLRERGYLPLQCLPLGPHDCRYDLASSVDGGVHFFSLTIREVYPSGPVFSADGQILSRRENRGSCWIACEADQFYHALSSVDWGAPIPENQRMHLASLASALGPVQSGRIATELFGEESGQGVVAACADGQWEKVAKRLKAQSRHRRFGIFFSASMHGVAQFESVLRRWFRAGGLYIVILGPDGAGKSTLTNKILELFGPLFSTQRILQWRPQFLKPRPRYSPGFNPPHGKPPRGFIESTFRVFAVLADYWIAYPTIVRPLLARVALIIYDRDFHDLLVDRMRYQYGGPDWLPRFAAKLLPRPETLYLTLDAEPDIILSRKNEVALEELRRQRVAYANLAAELPSSTLIRTDEGVEASVAAATKAILTHLSDRFTRHQRRPVNQAGGKNSTHRISSPAAPTNRCDIHEPRLNRLVELVVGLKSWLLKGSLAIADQGLISGSNFVLSILLARYLGVDQYGAYALAFSTFVLLSLVHQSLVLEPLSVFGPSVYRNSLRRYLGLIMWLQLAMGAVFVIAAGSVGVFVSFLRGYSQLAMPFCGMAFAAPCVLLLWFARRAFYLQLLPGRALIGALAYSTFLWLGIWVLVRGHLLSAFSAFLVMGTCALLTSILLLIRLQPTVRWKGTEAWVAMKEVGERHWHYGVWALVSSLFYWIPWNIFYPLVAHFSGLAEAGVLRALLNLALPITSAYAAFSMLFISHAARLGHEGGWQAVKIQAWRVAGLFAMGSGSYWLLVCLFREQIVHFLYAGQYSQVATLMPVLAISSILSGATLGPAIAIRAMRSPSAVALVYFGASLVALLVGIPACRQWGIHGAMLSILLSSITAFLTGFQILRSRAREQLPEIGKMATIHVEKPTQTNPETA
jgi:O-antigen/teichoic acid export membrane protein/thymidylate kinase